MGTAFLYGNGGGTGCTGATLTVTAPAGVTVTVSKDGKTKTKVSGADGVAVFKGLSSGDWLLSITDGTHTAQKTVTITADYNIVISFSVIPEFTYTGDFEVVNDSDEHITTSHGNWKIRFLTSGMLTFTELKGAENGIDVFLVGGGASGAARKSGGVAFGGGGGSGYTTTGTVNVQINTPYKIVIGAGGSGVPCDSVGIDGGKTIAFGLVSNGGIHGGRGTDSGTAIFGGDGGSGGGGAGGYGGTDGRAGTNSGGSGQGTTTREFGDAGGTLYASGGDGGVAVPISGADNTGDGGDGGKNVKSGSGGSGIVIIRNSREVS